MAKDPAKSWGRSDAQVPTCTYRFFDAFGRLLYVGVTDDFEARCRGHRRAHWWPQVARTDIVWFMSRLDALYEESRAIDYESPIYNRRDGLSPIGLTLIRIPSWRTRRLVSVPAPRLAVTRYDKDKVLREVSQRSAHATVSFEGVERGFLVPWAWYQEAVRRLGPPSNVGYLDVQLL